MMTLNIETILKYPYVFFAGFVVTYLLTPLAKWTCGMLGMLDMPGERRVHDRPVPRCGITVFLGFHAACAAVFVFPWEPFAGALSAVWWWHFLIISTILLGVGIADDLKGLRPVVKLGGQVLVAILAFAFDMRVGRVLGADLPVAIDLFATVLWFLMIINAFNLIDGIDGLATGLAAIAALGLAGSFMFRHLPGDALILFGLIGACSAFLRYNAHPASVFLGDAGSMFLGLVLASVPLITGAKGTALASIGVPLLAVGVPVLDTVLAVWRRGARRVLQKTGPETELGETAGKIFQADMDHVHHRLLRSGLSQAATAARLHGISIALVVVALLTVVFRSQALGIYILSFVVATYVVVRHLARVELWDSGRAISYGLSRPPRNALTVLVYPLADIAAMAAALALACYLTAPVAVWPGLKRHWFDQVPLWVGVPFLVLFLSRAYSRVWSRARLSEYVMLGAALAGGVLLASGLAIITEQVSVPAESVVLNTDAATDVTVIVGRAMPRWYALQTLLHVGVSVFLVAGMRIFPRVILDTMAWSSGGEPMGTGMKRNAIVYGAGDHAILFLVDASMKPLEGGARRRVVGILDSDRNLHGRLVHGCRVMGGADAFGSVAAKEQVTELIIAEELDERTLAALSEEAGRRGISVWRWRPALVPLDGTKAVTGAS